MVDGRPEPVWCRMPSRTSAVRFSPRPSRSSTSTTRTECSLWWNSDPYARSERSSASSPVWPNGGWPRSWPSAIASVRSSFSLSARATAREMPGHLERVGHPRAEVVALGSDEDLRLVLEAAKGLRVDDPVAVALKRRPQRALTLVRVLRAPAVSYDFTARSDSAAASRRRMRSAKAAATGPVGCGI